MRAGYFRNFFCYNVVMNLTVNALKVCKARYLLKDERASLFLDKALKKEGHSLDLLV